jgi:hypothetical protein
MLMVFMFCNLCAYYIVLGLFHCLLHLAFIRLGVLFMKHIEGGQNNGRNKKLRNRSCVGYIERISVGNTEYSSSVCLQSVVLV